MDTYISVALFGVVIKHKICVAKKVDLCDKWTVSQRIFSAIPVIICRLCKQFRVNLFFMLAKLCLLFQTKQWQLSRVNCNLGCKTPPLRLVILILKLCSALFPFLLHFELFGLVFPNLKILSRSTSCINSYSPPRTSFFALLSLILVFLPL